jgi:NAD(P)-dependent dehydrogenase (short-subunit alcohol dehydrogenase family)
MRFTAATVPGYTVSPAVTLWRADLLRSRSVVLAGGPEPALAAALAALGAEVRWLDASDEDGLDEDRALASARAFAPIDALVYDAGPSFGGGGEPGLGAALERGWIAVRAAVAGGMIERPGGKLVLLGPRPHAGEHAAAAAAALENLARTLSVEWARYGITATMIAPGAETSLDDVAGLVAFLVSVAGDYFSGCRFELGA